MHVAASHRGRRKSGFWWLSAQPIKTLINILGSPLRSWKRKSRESLKEMFRR
jgi:hypothetical protein